MDEAAKNRLNTQTQRLLEEIEKRSKGTKPEKVLKRNPFTNKQVKVKRADAASGAFFLDDIDPIRVAPEHAADDLVRGPDGKLVAKGVDMGTIGKARKTNYSRPD